MNHEIPSLNAARASIQRQLQRGAMPLPQQADVLQQAKSAYNATMQTYRSMGISPADYLGPIWANNLERHLIPNIQKAQSVEEAIGYLNDKAFYDFSCSEPYLTPSIDWRLRLLQRRHGVTLSSLPPELCESPFVLRKHCKTIEGRLLSSDFLNRLAWVFRLHEVLAAPEGRFSILEVGGGFGALARVFKLVHPRSRVVLVDIPESLFFQHTFLRACFPDAKHQYLRNADEAVEDDADFVYVANGFARALAQAEFFLAVNTNSFGEMPEQQSSRWLELVQRETSTANVFFLNRFLNRIDKGLLETRAGHSSWSFGLDSHWVIREWEVDPDYERCPYFQTTLTRNLHVIASRAPDDGRELRELRQRAQTIALEDWCRRPGWDNFRFVTGADYPPLMSRGDLDLTPDMTQGGTLYTLWSLVRLTRDAQWIELLVAYLDYLNGQQVDRFFEEIPTVMRMLPRAG